MWVKICGIRDRAAATLVAALAPDAIGLNFYAGTIRHVDATIAAQIASSLPSSIEPIGLFVNKKAETIHSVCSRCSLQTIQLHGDELPETIRELADYDASYRIIRAWNLGPEGLGPLGDYLSRLRELKVRPTACLIDARVEGKHGGTGRIVDWELLGREYDHSEWPPLILAGGLTPENVADAIQAVKPWGVDVASGVESAPGVKDFSLVEQFIQSAREASESMNDVDHL
ncbi:MAG: phosphoribosylanthranilate isomerase [Planctomycetaceae bacterium]|jgi:phosphoribosylanthranilate isomerase|nr:phosphoribosylanthranilate isomerase [Planctomycetaceae bacterium]MBT6155473.1 phosphoribosylanthranilate isomerase [Planctomycetaceae bacterium]MBT6483667.1 phosphoribosylanthranilate isomerase [Planctomycetaceae bacterium]MBT6496290.1 phosphoribosylanthranilate isomerase [Planctomycetaceae bacterium]